MPLSAARTAATHRVDTSPQPDLAASGGMASVIRPQWRCSSARAALIRTMRAPAAAHAADMARVAAARRCATLCRTSAHTPTMPPPSTCPALTRWTLPQQSKRLSSSLFERLLAVASALWRRQPPMRVWRQFRAGAKGLATEPQQSRSWTPHRKPLSAGSAVLWPSGLFWAWPISCCGPGAPAPFATCTTAAPAALFALKKTREGQSSRCAMFWELTGTDLASMPL